MKKVLIVHGYRGFPNGAWRPWLMTELEKLGIYACALPMPGFDSPVCSEWVKEVSRYAEADANDEIFLVGHSLGSTTILRYLENMTKGTVISGSVLVSTPIEKTRYESMNNFFEKPFDFELIRTNCKKFSVIYGVDDTYVSQDEGKRLSLELSCSPIEIQNGGHLSGKNGWNTLPQALTVLLEMIG